MTVGTGKPALDAAEFEALYLRLRQVPAWGAADRRGALNYLTPERVLAAAGEITLGRTVSLAAPIETGLTPDDPAPAIHEMIEKIDSHDTQPQFAYAVHEVPSIEAN